VLPSKQVLTQLIGSVYDAASEPSLWEPFLGELAKTCRADSAALVMHNGGREVHAVSASWNLDPDGHRLYQQHYGSTDVWAMRGQSKADGPSCTSDWLCPLEELVTTEFYNDFLSRYDIVHGMFGLVGRSADSWASVSLYRGSHSRTFRVSDLGTLNLLVPHIQRALRLHFEFSELKARNEGMETALNMLTIGVILLGAKGEVLLMNRRAEEVLNRRDGLLLTNGKLSAAIYGESGRFQMMIGGAAHTGCGKGFSAGGTILISREKGRPISVTAAPLHEFSANLSQQPAAVLFISDPDQRVELPSDMLRRCYGLTPAEARLAMILVEGRSLKEAADSCAVTHNTAKSQLKSVFMKTQVRRQGELIRLLLNTSGFAQPH
jgi:DNA-binding CsgD family transcriptional regulator/PAS domain-containing protein